MTKTSKDIINVSGWQACRNITVIEFDARSPKFDFNSYLQLILQFYESQTIAWQTMYPQICSCVPEVASKFVLNQQPLLLIKIWLFFKLETIMTSNDNRWKSKITSLFNLSWHIQAFLDFRGFNFRNFFNAVYNSILFSSPSVQISNLDLRGFCFLEFLFASPH